MPAVGANMAILREGTILLMQREDFEVWAMPGGGTEPGESQAETAVREAREETGLEVEITGLVGCYMGSALNPELHSVCFRGSPVGGDLLPQGSEVLDLRWFPVDELPADMFWWHRQQIVDAAAGIHGAAWRFEINAAEPFDSRAQLYQLRDRSSMSRVGFYRQMFESGDLNRSICHSKGVRHG